MADSVGAPAPFARARQILADTSLVLLSVALWAGVTLLLALGCLLLVGILVADGHPARFFLHAQNLATHYLAADAAARARFHGQLGAAYLGLAALLGTARAPSFVRRLREQLTDGRRHD